MSSRVKLQVDLPGPGTYGKGGVPWAVMEEKAKQSVCMTGVIEGGSGRSHTLKNEVSTPQHYYYKIHSLYLYTVVQSVHFNFDLCYYITTLPLYNSNLLHWYFLIM